MLPSLHRCSISTGPAARCELRPPINELPADAAEVILKELLAVLEDETHPCQLLSTLSRVQRDGLFGDTAVSITYEALKYMKLSKALEHYDRHYASTMPTMPEAKRQEKAVLAVCSDVLRLHRLFKEASQLPSLQRSIAVDGSLSYPRTHEDIFKMTLTRQMLFFEYVILAMPEHVLRRDSAFFGFQDVVLNYENANLVAKIVGKHGAALTFFKDSMKKNRDVVMAAVQNDGMVLELVQLGRPRLGTAEDREVVKAAVSNKGAALKFASPDLQADAEITLIAVQNDGLALQYARDPSLAVMTAAVENNGVALRVRAARGARRAARAI
jgi:hypothetical protein